jgi:nicotinate-nucleotide adenylyltransferase
MTAQKPIGILGGTFDPIHKAHLTIAQYALEKLDLKEVRFIPCHRPVHRATPKASAKDRLAMLTLATKPYANFVVDDLELKKQNPSYTVDTLQTLRASLGQVPFCFILGKDAFALFNQWKDWKLILTLTHLIVINRPSTELPHANWMENLLKQHKIHNSKLLQIKAAGFIYQLSLPALAISATGLREQLIKSHLILNDIPKTVLDYIHQHKLYQ